MHGLKTIFLVMIVLLTACVARADQLPGVEEVENLARASSEAFDGFITKTFPVRAQIDYSGEITDPNDLALIMEAAKKAVNSLEVILKSQELIREKIERYEGDDWDELFGKTSLWRASVAGVRQSRRRICVIDYHRAMALTGVKKQRLLQSVLGRIDSGIDYPQNENDLLKIRVLWALDPEADPVVTIRRLDTLIASSTIDNGVFFEAIIMRMELSQHTDTKKLNALAKSLEDSGLKNNFELLFKLAMEELKNGSNDIIRLIADRHRPAGHAAGLIILDDIVFRAGGVKSAAEVLGEKTAAEVFLAASAAIKEQNSKYAEVCEQMCRMEKFRSAGAFLAAGVSCRDNYPRKAVEYYMAAARKSKTTDPLIGIEPVMIAEQGAKLAVSLYYKDRGYLSVAERAMEFYFSVAGDKPDAELEYIYASMILETEKAERGVEILKRLAGGGELANEAKLELFFYRTRNSEPRSQKRNAIIAEVEKFIATISSIKVISPEIVDRTLMLYCKLLVEEGGEGNGETALRILKSKPIEESTDAAILKAGALCETGNLLEALDTLAGLVNREDTKAHGLAVAVISTILEDIDEYRGKVEDFGDFTDKCRKTARFAASFFEEEGQAVDFHKKYLEICIIDTPEDSKKLTEIESLVEEQLSGNTSDIDLMRCKARLFMKQQRYAEAFRVWSAIARARKPDRGSEKSAKWWRAKYYSLECYSKVTNPQNNDLSRATEILIKANENIPDFWKRKLLSLKTSTGAFSNP